MTWMSKGRLYELVDASCPAKTVLYIPSTVPTSKRNPAEFVFTVATAFGILLFSGHKIVFFHQNSHFQNLHIIMNSIVYSVLVGNSLFAKYKRLFQDVCLIYGTRESPAISSRNQFHKHIICNFR